MKLLVTGVRGQLGYDVVKRAQAHNIDVVGIGVEELDLIDEAAVKSYFVTHNDFDAIIHCAAYTAVDNAEEQNEQAEKVNVLATQLLVNEAKKMHAKFMYISTDYVYSGEGDVPFTEDSKPAPISVYGQTKLAGEEITQTLAEHFIVRISWVFGINGNNFIKTMLKLAENHTELTVVNDQFGSPTYTYDLAKLLITMIQTDKYGVYQASNEGFCSWYDFAVEIFKLANKDVSVVPVDSSQFPTKAARPKNSRMSKDKLVEMGFEKLPSWEDATKRYLAELAQQ